MTVEEYFRRLEVIEDKALYSKPDFKIIDTETLKGKHLARNVCVGDRVIHRPSKLLKKIVMANTVKEIAEAHETSACTIRRIKNGEISLNMAKYLAEGMDIDHELLIGGVVK